MQFLSSLPSVNIHISNELRMKYPQYEFRGKSWERGGFTWIKVLYYPLNVTWFFCFEEECALDKVSYELKCNSIHGEAKENNPNRGA